MEIQVPLPPTGHLQEALGMTRVNVQFDISPSTFIEEAVQNMNSANSESACSILSELAKNHFLHRLDSLVEEGHALRYQQVGGIGQHSIDPHSLRQACSAPMSIGHFDVTLCQERKGVRPKLVPVLPDNLHVERNSDFFEADDEWWIEVVS